MQIKARSASLVKHLNKHCKMTHALETAKEQYEMLAELVRAEAIELDNFALLQDQVRQCRHKFRASACDAYSRVNMLKFNTVSLTPFHASISCRLFDRMCI